MPALATFLPQLALVLVPLVTAILAYKTARRHQLPPVASATPITTNTSGTTLNGSFLIIRTCLERLQTLQALYDEEHTRAIRLEARLDECQRRHAARKASAKPPATPNAPPQAPAAQSAGEIGLAPTPATTPASSRSGRRRRAQG